MHTSAATNAHSTPGIPSGSPTLPTTQAPATGGQACGARPSGFTLIEVLFCMVIFGVAFAAIAMLLPAGAIMQKDIVSNAVGGIVGRNTMEVLKAKGLNSLPIDILYSDYKPTQISSGFWGGDANNFETDLNDSWNGRGYRSWMVAQGGRFGNSPVIENPTFLGLINISGNYNTVYYPGDGTGYTPPQWDDTTNLAWGRISVFKGRPPANAVNHFSMLDFSYPSSVLNYAQRSYYSTVLKTNQSLQFQTEQAEYTNGGAAPKSHQWKVSVITCKRPENGEWPELAEFDPNNPAYCGGSAAAGEDSYTHDRQYPCYLHSVTACEFRSAGGDSSVAGQADPGPNYLWPSYNNGRLAAAFYVPDGGAGPYPMGVVPTTGGDPNNANPYARGWVAGGKFGYEWYGSCWAVNSVSSAGNAIRENQPSKYPFTCSGWHPYTGGMTYNEYWYADGSVTNVIPPYRYPIPLPIQIPAICYDLEKDLVLMRYPMCYAKTWANTPSNGASKPTKEELQNERIRAWRQGVGYPATWQDRRLQVGDRFMLANGSFPFTVKEVLDPIAAGLAAPGGAMDWSDGTYALIRVSPSLRVTNYTANKPEGGDTTPWNGAMYPQSAIVAPPPVEGGSSPWVSTIQLQNANGVVFRDWNNLTD